MLFPIIILLCVHVCGAQRDLTKVLLTPMSYAAAEGSSGVLFACTAPTPSDINFFVDGSPLNTELAVMRGIHFVIVSTTMALLIIQPYPMNHNTTLICYSFIEGMKTKLSAPALLQVQGRLSAPSSLTLLPISQSYRRLSWTPPFTLDLTDENPDIIGYRVCFNLSNPPVIVEESLQCIVTQESSYIFPNIRHSLQISVTALNLVGDGNSSVITYQACTAGMVV